MTVCRCIKHKKTQRMSQTQAVAGINSLNSKSLESSDSVQQNEGGQGSQEHSRKKNVAAHQSDRSDFHLSRVRIGDTNFSDSDLVASGLCPVASASPKCCFPT